MKKILMFLCLAAMVGCVSTPRQKLEAGLEPYLGKPIEQVIESYEYETEIHWGVGRMFHWSSLGETRYDDGSVEYPYAWACSLDGSSSSATYYSTNVILKVDCNGVFTGYEFEREHETKRRKD